MEDFLYRVGHIVHLLRRHGRIQRQGNQQRVHIERPRALIFRPRRIGSEERVQWYRDEMHTCANSTAPQFLDELISTYAQFIQPEANHIEVPRMAASQVVRRKDQFLRARQRLIVMARVLGAPFDEAFQLAQLMDADRRLDVAQVVFEPRLLHLVIPASILRVAVPGVLADAVQGEQQHSLRQPWRVGCDHAAFTCRHVLSGVKTERHSVASRPQFSGAYMMAPILRSRGMCGIFNYRKIVPAGKGPDALHVAGQSSQMNGKDRPRPGSNALRNRVGIDIAIGTNVSQNWSRPQVQDRVHRGTKRERGGDYLIAWPYSESGERKVKGSRSGTDRQTPARSYVSLELPLELRGSLAGRQPTAAYGSGQFVDFFFANFGQAKRNIRMSA